MITLTTDFGWRDGYVAAMKGVILGIQPHATLVDVSHDVPPQDVPHGAFVLGTACPYFPTDSIHVAVVDPGVGTARRPLLVVTPRGRYVAPDNGLLTYVLMGLNAGDKGTWSPQGEEGEFMRRSYALVPEGTQAYHLNRDEFWLQPVSDTFHGRDIFAPVAAHLSRGVSPEDLGDPVEEVVVLRVPPPHKQGDLLQGRVIHIDRFGNLVSNIPSADLPEDCICVEVGGKRIRGLTRSYAGEEELVAVAGSHGYLEVAVRGGSAAKRLGAKVGSKVIVTLR